jgi:hypothetical protein
VCHGCGSPTCSFITLWRGVPLDFSSRQSETFESLDKECDDYYGSYVRIRFVKQKNRNLLNFVRDVLVPSKNQIANTKGNIHLLFKIPFSTPCCAASIMNK